MDLQLLTLFIKKHLLLTASFVFVLLIIVLNEISLKKSQARTLTPQELIIIINDEHPVIIDLRDSDSYKKAHILGSKNITNKELNPADFEKYKKNPLVLVCEQGVISKNFANKLKSLGWSNVFNLTGGITAWRENGLPFEKK